MPIQNSKLVKQVRTLLRPGAPEDALRNLLEELQPYDLSILLSELDENHQTLLLKTLPPETAAETLEHFEPVEQYLFLDHLEEETTISILNNMSSDAVVQLFTAIHPRQVERLSAMLQPPFREQIKNQMAYPENSAGSLATMDYIAARRWWTVEQVLAHLRKVGTRVELYNYIYILEIGRASCRERV